MASASAEITLNVTAPEDATPQIPEQGDDEPVEVTDPEQGDGKPVEVVDPERESCGGYMGAGSLIAIFGILGGAAFVSLKKKEN